MFGGMEQQAENRGRQLRATHATGLQKRVLWCGSDLRERAFDGAREISGEAGGRVRIGVRFSLAPQESQLLGRKLFTSRIGEEPIEAAGGVPHVEAG